MRIEHVAVNVADAKAMAEWYVEHLDFSIIRSGSAPIDMRFIADESKQVLMEIYNNPECPVPDYPEQNPLMLHVAFVSSDVVADRDRLLAAGASAAGEITRTPAGDTLAMLRDPWGLAIQLCQRAEPML